MKSEHRTLVWTWIDTVASLKPDEEFHIPVKHGGERQLFVRLIKEELAEYNAAIPLSIYSDITARGSLIRGVYYIVLKKHLHKDKGYIVDRKEHQRALAVLPRMKYNRIREIFLLLEDGFSKDEIIEALGKSITSAERDILS